MKDQMVLTGILSGDKRALIGFYRTYAPRLSRYIKTKVNNDGDSEEILQDTLFAFLESIRDFNGDSSIQTFLFSICSHKIIDYYRRKKIAHVVFSKMPQLEFLVSPLLGPEEELDTTMLKEKIRNVLHTLLPHHRQILLFKYVDDLSVAEIAQRLAITFKSAESQLFRARKAFVEAFLSI